MRRAPKRDGAEFIGGYGQKAGDSDLRFIEGQLPEEGDRIASDASPTRQLELALRNLETELKRYGRDINDVFQLTLYLAEMDAYEQVDNTYEQYFEETYRHA